MYTYLSYSQAFIVDPTATGQEFYVLGWPLVTILSSELNVSPSERSNLGMRSDTTSKLSNEKTTEGIYKTVFDNFDGEKLFLKSR